MKDLFGRSFVASSTRESGITRTESDRRAVAINARRILVAGALFLLVSLPANAATFYVSLAGLDSNTCAKAKVVATAKKTIAAGVACLAPGDTLLLRAGTYSGPSNIIDSSRFIVPSGTSWAAPVTIGGYPGETVTIRPLDGLQAIKLTTGAPKYLIFQDLVVDMADSKVGGSELEAIYLSDGANHNRFQRLEVKNGKSFGIVFSRNGGNSPFNDVLNSKIHSTGNGSGSNTNGHGLYISSSDNFFEGNEVYNNQGFGFHFYDDDGPKYVNRNIVTKNNVHNNGTDGGIAYGIVVAWGADNLIYDNSIYNNPGGILVYSGAANTAIYNNSIYNNNPLEAISLQYYSSAPTVYNNVIYGNGSAVMDYGGTGTALVSNNIMTNPALTVTTQPAPAPTPTPTPTPAPTPTPVPAPVDVAKVDAIIANAVGFLNRVKAEYTATELLVTGMIAALQQLKK